MGDLEGNSQTAEVTDTTNATVTAADGRTAVTILAAASGGPMTVTVEFSHDGTNWFEDVSVFSTDVATGDSEAEHVTTGADHIRASGDANVGHVVVTTKGA